MDNQILYGTFLVIDAEGHTEQNDIGKSERTRVSLDDMDVFRFEDGHFQKLKIKDAQEGYKDEWVNITQAQILR